MIHEHENCNVFTDGGGASVAGAECAFLGAQSLVWAWGERPALIEESFDYGNEKAYAWSFIAGVDRPVFNSLDYGSVGIALARTNISGA